jgi:hypothetical protein
MIHPATELRYVNDTIGYGVFATRFIPRGTMTWVRDKLDQAFTASRMSAMDRSYWEILEKYSFVDRNGHAILCWDLARFVNHSCEANCLGAGYDFEIAVEDIEPGEELTDDYGTLNLAAPFACSCSARGCRRAVVPDDAARYADLWDRRVQGVFSLLPHVEQPLWRFVEEKAEIELALKDPARLRSARFNLFVGTNPLARVADSFAMS